MIRNRLKGEELLIEKPGLFVLLDKMYEGPPQKSGSPHTPAKGKGKEEEKETRNHLGILWYISLYYFLLRQKVLRLVSSCYFWPPALVQYERRSWRKK